MSTNSTNPNTYLIDNGYLCTHPHYLDNQPANPPLLLLVITAMGLKQALLVKERTGIKVSRNYSIFWWMTVYHYQEPL
jgi:hypothetical protein